MPLAELGKDVFGHEDDLRGATDELVVRGPWTGCDEGEHGAAVWRGDRDPALAGSELRIERQLESELVQVESQAAILIPNEDPNGVDP
jgi:hypothetical protein